jgi:hypothetical protein
MLLPANLKKRSYTRERPLRLKEIRTPPLTLLRGQIMAQTIWPTASRSPQLRHPAAIKPPYKDCPSRSCPF